MLRHWQAAAAELQPGLLLLLLLPAERSFRCHLPLYHFHCLPTGRLGPAAVVEAPVVVVVVVSAAVELVLVQPVEREQPWVELAAKGQLWS